MKLDELKKLADNCCSNYVTIDTKYIQQLIALIEMQHEALKTEQQYYESSEGNKADITTTPIKRALAAYDKFNGGE